MASNKTLNQSKNLRREPTNNQPSASLKSPRNINLFSNHSLSSLFALSSAWSSSLCSRILFNTSSLASCNLKKKIGRLDDKTKSIKHNAYKWKWNNGLKLIIINYNNHNYIKILESRGKNISDTLGYASCATFLLLPHFDVIYDLLL